MGVGTILDADRIIMMAWGEGEAPVIKETVEGPIRENIPATYLQEHSDATVILDGASAEYLRRRKTLWLPTCCDWDNYKIKKGVVWLCQEVDKPVLKLNDEEYNKHGMGDLLTQYGPAYDINLKVFNELQHTITGWPGGKPNAEDTNRPECAEPFPNLTVPTVSA